MDFVSKGNVLKARLTLLTLGYTFTELNKMNDDEILSLAILSVKNRPLSS